VSRKSDHGAPSGAVHPLLAQQRAIGNQRVRHLLDANPIQAKLSVSEPGDAFEREADQAAAAVMRTPDGSSSASPSPGLAAPPRLHRMQLPDDAVGRLASADHRREEKDRIDERRLEDEKKLAQSRLAKTQEQLRKDKSDAVPIGRKEEKPDEDDERIQKKGLSSDNRVDARRR
jgi:hypothetical protein